MKEPFINITKDILRLVAELDEFKGEWKALGNLAPHRLKALKKIATIESVGSSTRIEGVKLTDREVEQLLSGFDTRSFRSRDEEEVAGYAEAMNLVFESFQEILVTENHIKQLHSILLKYSLKDVRHRGEYKKLPNHVEAFDHNGKSLGIIFETALPFETPMKMETLLKWTNHNLEAKELHPLLIIAIFIVHFLAIHPFQDGNGRLSRILTTLLLSQNGYSYIPYSSLESIFEQNKYNYYLALRKAQHGKHINSLKNQRYVYIRHFSSLTKNCNARVLFHAFAGFEAFLAGCFLQEYVKIQRVDYFLSFIR